MSLKNIKEPITSGIGLIIIILTLISVYKGAMSWQYEATIAVTIGVLLLLAPDKIVAIIIKTFDKISKGNGSNTGTGTNC